jgi:hypothetical protein
MKSVPLLGGVRHREQAVLAVGFPVGIGGEREQAAKALLPLRGIAHVAQQRARHEQPGRGARRDVDDVQRQPREMARHVGRAGRPPQCMQGGEQHDLQRRDAHAGASARTGECHAHEHAVQAERRVAGARAGAVRRHGEGQAVQRDKGRQRRRLSRCRQAQRQRRRHAQQHEHRRQPATVDAAGRQPKEQ